MVRCGDDRIGRALPRGKGPRRRGVYYFTVRTDHATLALLLPALAAAAAASGCEQTVEAIAGGSFEQRFSDARIRARFVRQRAALERLRAATLKDDVIALRPGSIGRRGHALQCWSRTRGARFPWTCKTPAGERPARDAGEVGRRIGLPGEAVRRYLRQINALGAKGAYWRGGEWIVYITGQSGRWSKQIVWSRRPPARLEADSMLRPELLTVSSRLQGDWYIRRTGPAR